MTLAALSAQLALEDDNASLPYIFTDSTDCSVSQSSAHMFLSYATGFPNDVETRGKTSLLESPQSSFSQDLSPPATPRHQNATPHLFLNYAGRCARSTSILREATTRRTPSTRTPSEDRPTLTPPWGRSPEEFESGCYSFLRTDHGVSSDWAVLLSSTFRMAAEVAQRSRHPEKKKPFSETRGMAEYTTHICNALKSEERVASFHSRESNDSTPDLKEKVQRQEREILFLREALKSLVHLHMEEDDDDDESTLEPPPPRDIVLQTSEKKSAVHEVEPFTTTPVKEDVPFTIDISPRMISVMDDLTASEYTASEKSFQLMALTSPSPSNERNPLVDPPLVQATPVLYNSILYSTRNQTRATTNHATSSLGWDTTKNNNSNPTATNFMTAMQMVYQYREQQERLRLCGGPHDQSYTEMARGEVKGKRARGLRFQVYFPSWGVALQGNYNGMVQENGLPHGSGVLRFDNRDYYLGEFVNGALHGQGSLFLRRDNRLLTFRGRFEHNEFVGWNGPRPRMLPSDETVSAGAA